MNSTQGDEREPKAEPSTRTPQIPPMPQESAEEKKEHEAQAAEIAKPKPSGAV